jgi:hypothetical protein
MSNIDAIDQASPGIKHAPAASTLIGQKPNPWFNVIAGIVVVAANAVATVIYTNSMSPNLAVVWPGRWSRIIPACSGLRCAIY